MIIEQMGVPLALKTLHLTCLQLRQIELARVDAADLVTHDVGRDVLLGALLGRLGLAKGLLEQVLVGLLDAAETEVHAGTMLLELNTRETLTGSLGADQVAAKVEDWLGSRVIRVPAPLGGLIGCDDHNVLQSLNVDLVGYLAAEEVDEHGPGHGEGRGYGALKGCAGEHHEGAGTNGDLLGLELADAAERLGVEVELEHVEQLVVKGARKGDGARTLLAAAGEQDETAVVLLGEEGEGASIFKGVDGVLLVEALGVRLPHGVEVGQGILSLRGGCQQGESIGVAPRVVTYDLVTCRPSQEESCLWVLDNLGRPLLKSALGARRPGFAAV